MSDKSRTTKALEEYRQALRDGAFIGLCALLKYIAEGGHLDARDMEEAALNSIDEAIQKTNRGMKRNGLEGVKSIFQDALADWVMNLPADETGTPRRVREGIREVAEELAREEPGAVGPGFPLLVLPAVRRRRPHIIEQLESTDPGYGDHVYQTVTMWIPRALRGGP